MRWWQYYTHFKGWVFYKQLNCLMIFAFINTFEFIETIKKYVHMDVQILLKEILENSEWTEQKMCVYRMLSK